MNMQRAVAQSRLQGAPRPHSEADSRPEPEAVWDDEERWAMIAENAYYRAERRGFLPGYEFEDWLAAEKEMEDETRGMAGA